MSNLQINTSDDLTQKKLVKAWWKKVTATQLNKPDSKLAFPVKGVFGIPLLHSIQYAYTTITFIDEELGSPCVAVIPTIIAKCGSYLKENGLTVEGIFRLSGSSKRISQLQALFDTPETHYGVHLTWEGFNVHDVSNVMRRFLNHLPEPVIPLKYHSSFKKTMGMDSTSEEKIQAFQKLIDQIPLANQFLLLYLLDILNLFSLTSHITRMDIQALASLFAPGILSHPDDDLNPSGYKESQYILEFLLQHQEKFNMPKKKYPFIKTECITRPNPPLPQPIMMQHSISTPSDMFYSNSDKYIHPLYSSTLDTQSMSSLTHPTLSSVTLNQPFYGNVQSSKSMIQVKNSKITSIEEPIPSSSTSSSSIRRTKTLPGSSHQSKSVISLISIKRERQQSVPNTSPKSPPVRRWKSIRTVPTSPTTPTMNHQNNSNHPIFTQ